MCVLRFAALLALALALSFAWAAPLGRTSPKYDPSQRFEPSPDFLRPLQSDGKPNNDQLKILLKNLNQDQEPRTIKKLIQDQERRTASDKESDQAFKSLSEDGQAVVSIEPEGQPDRYSGLNVKVSNRGQIFETKIDLPKWEFFKLEKRVIQRRMVKALEDIPPDLPIFFTSLPPSLSVSDLLPGRIAARTFDKSARDTKEQVKNFENFLSVKWNAKSTKFFNFVAPPEGSSRSKESRWSELRKGYDEVAEELGMQFGSEKEELLKTMEDGKVDVVVVVAHGNKSSIVLRDGKSLTARDILNLPVLPENASERRPIVVLLSCETGSSSSGGVATIADAIMRSGRASTVLAPTRQVSAGQQTVELLKQLVQSAERGELREFIKQLSGPWQIIVEETEVRLFQEKRRYYYL